MLNRNTIITRVGVRTAITRIALLERMGMNNCTAIGLFVDMQVEDSIPGQCEHCGKECYQHSNFYFSKEFHQTL